MGFGAPAEAVRRLHVVILDSPVLHPRNRLRVRLTVTALRDAGAACEVVDVLGACPLEAATRACFLADWTSLYLAMLNGVDPSPMEPVDRLKAALAREPLG